jgi:hypothetical protein
MTHLEPTANTADWYRQFRSTGYRPNDALSSARIHAKAYAEATAVMASLTAAERTEIDKFVDDFIRSEFVSTLTSERDSDFISDSDRANRCYAAAEDGGDGKTHSEVIDDWRDAFGYYQDDFEVPDWFDSAVRANFNLTELWHHFNGSLFEVIG